MSESNSSPLNARQLHLLDGECEGVDLEVL